MFANEHLPIESGLKAPRVWSVTMEWYAETRTKIHSFPIKRQDRDGLSTGAFQLADVRSPTIAPAMAGQAFRINGACDVSIMPLYILEVSDG